MVFPAGGDPLQWGPGNADDIKAFTLVTMDDATKLHARMVALRTQWTQMLVTAGEQQKAARIFLDQLGLPVTPSSWGYQNHAQGRCGNPA